MVHSRFITTLGTASLLLLTGLAGQVGAENLRVPSSVYRMDKFEEAKAKAMESGEPLVFLYTDPASR